MESGRRNSERAGKDLTLELAILRIVAKKGNPSWRHVEGELSRVDVPRTPNAMDMLKGLEKRGFLVRTVYEGNPADVWSMTQAGFIRLETMESMLASVGYDPINDEKKVYSKEEFTRLAKQSFDEYYHAFCDNPNDFQAGMHTFSEWMNSFLRWNSW